MPQSIRRRRQAQAIAATTLAALCAAAPASAGQAWPYDGSLNVLTASSGCSTAVGVADYYSAIYRPKLAGEASPGALHFYKGRQAVRYEDLGAGGQFRGSGKYQGTRLSGRGTIETFTGTYALAVSPSSITTQTSATYAQVTGTITNFENQAGCTVKIRGSFELRPN